MTLAIPTIGDIEAAQRRLAGKAVLTPLIELQTLNEVAGARVLLKAECLQRTGSFKFRGAWNRISQLGPEMRKGGVVAYSSGNHAQGVAAAARIRNFPALIVMPADTPLIKQNNTRQLGADTVLYDRARDSREAIALAICKERGAVLVPPFEDTDVIAGQGTAGLEIAAQSEAIGAVPDVVLVPASGGGLSSGIALASEAMLPRAEVYCVEPEGFDDYARSLRSGKREHNEKAAGGLCDALDEPGARRDHVRDQLPSAQGWAGGDRGGGQARHALRLQRFETRRRARRLGRACGHPGGKNRNPRAHCRRRAVRRERRCRIVCVRPERGRLRLDKGAGGAKVKGDGWSRPLQLRGAQ